MKIRLTFTAELLGSKPATADLIGGWLGPKAPGGVLPPDELANAQAAEALAIEERSSSIFHRQNGQVGIYAYQILGFFKAAAGALNRWDKEYRNNLEKLAAYKTKIDTCIGVSPRFIPITLPPNTTLGSCERPIRADTAQGPRVGLRKSESVPEGSTLHFDLTLFSRELRPYLEEWLKYGALHGLGEWRNSGQKGNFTYEILDP